jgi:uncharacterized protein (UPF0548 family)
MFFVRKPKRAAIDEFLSRQQKSTFSYQEIGTTNSSVPRNYIVDRNRVMLGSGPQVFRQGIDRLRAWQMFKLGWVDVFPPEASISKGQNVAVLISHFGFWSLNACRIVYTFAEEHSYGFAYGTLQDHAEQGEERFSVDWSAQDDSVWYNILAFSRPRKWQTRIARPLSRNLQKKFARNSLAAMTQTSGVEPDSTWS